MFIDDVIMDLMSISHNSNLQLFLERICLCPVFVKISENSHLSEKLHRSPNAHSECDEGLQCPRFMKYLAAEDVDEIVILKKNRRQTNLV